MHVKFPSLSRNKTRKLKRMEIEKQEAEVKENENREKVKRNVKKRCMCTMFKQEYTLPPFEIILLNNYNNILIIQTDK